MTLNEILKSNGVSDESITAITTAMKENKIFTASEENLDVRYGKLKTDHEALTTKDAESQKLIAELQKASKDNESVQSKIAEYEQTIKNQQIELEQTKIQSALKVALLGEKAVDVDYLAYKIKENGDEIKLDDEGNIKNIKSIVDGLKTQFPTQFEVSNQNKKVDEHKLGSDDDKHDHENTVTQEDFDKMGYRQRTQLRQENPELYDALSNGN